MHIINSVIAFTLPQPILDSILALIAAILGWIGSKWHSKIRDDKQ